MSFNTYKNSGFRLGAYSRRERSKQRRKYAANIVPTQATATENNVFEKCEQTIFKSKENAP